ncbi:hypothetical protein ACFVYE_17810 [Streptomyces sp. NPDC058239]|uniref:hypothetical protein n=1 Tax=unclassified Streptomyces TaxID=2593676 RepID=UPI0036621A60
MAETRLIFAPREGRRTKAGRGLGSMLRELSCAHGTSDTPLLGDDIGRNLDRAVAARPVRHALLDAAVSVGLDEPAARWTELSCDDSVSIQYTQGTTGLTKGAGRAARAPAAAMHPSCFGLATTPRPTAQHHEPLHCGGVALDTMRALASNALVDHRAWATRARVAAVQKVIRALTPALEKAKSALRSAGIFSGTNKRAAAQKWL